MSEKDDKTKLVASLVFGLSNRSIEADAQTGPEETKSSNEPPIGIFNFVPRDEEALRREPLYQSIFKACQFQRDTYLVGSDYAEWMRREIPTQALTSGKAHLSISTDTISPGFTQLAGLCHTIVPSDTVLTSLVPLVTPLPNSLLLPLATNSLSRLIHERQRDVSSIMQRAVIEFLKNPDHRSRIKDSTKGLMSD